MKSIYRLIDCFVRKRSTNSGTDVQIDFDVKQSVCDNRICCLDLLSNEALIRVFEFLDFKSQMKAQSVCKLWHQLIEAMLEINTNIMIRDLDEGYEEFNEFKPFGLKDHKKRLELDLKSFRNKSFKSNKSYKRLTTGIVSKHWCLRALYLHLENSSLKKDILKMIANCCDTDLRQLSVIIANNEIAVNFTEVDNFCRKFPNIETFQLEAQLVSIEQKSLDVMIRVWQKLKHFILSHHNSKDKGKYKLKTFNGLCFQDISPQIKVIETSGHVLNRTAVFLMQFKGIKSIERISIEDLDHINTVQMLCYNFKSISKLSLSIFSKYSQTDGLDLLSAISQLKSLSHLRLLLDSCGHFLSHNSIQYLENCQHLTSLTIESTEMTADSVKAIAIFLPKLLTLNLILVNFEYDSDHCIAPIAQLKCLRSLHLSTVPDISHQSVVEIISSCPDLHFLDLSFSKHQSAQTLQTFINLAKTSPKDIFEIKVWHKMESKFRRFNDSIPRNLIIHYL